MEYHLMDGNVFKVFSNTTFISMLSGCSTEKLSCCLFNEKAGTFSNRTIIKNEYGLPIGKLSVDRWAAHPENIELEGKILLFISK